MEAMWSLGLSEMGRDTFEEAYPNENPWAVQVIIKFKSKPTPTEQTVGEETGAARAEVAGCQRSPVTLPRLDRPLLRSRLK